MPDIYERIARTMAKSESVGNYVSYDLILERLRATFADEIALRSHFEMRMQQLSELTGDSITFEDFLAEGDRDDHSA